MARPRKPFVLSKHPPALALSPEDKKDGMNAVHTSLVTKYAFAGENSCQKRGRHKVGLMVDPYYIYCLKHSITFGCTQ